MPLIVYRSSSAIADLQVSEHHSKWRREIFGRLLSAAPRAKGTLYFVCLPKFQDKAVQYSNIVSALQEQSAYNEARIVDLEGSAVKSSTEISTLDRKLSETTDQICQTSIKILALDEQVLFLLTLEFENSQRGGV